MQESNPSPRTSPPVQTHPLVGAAWYGVLSFVLYGLFSLTGGIMISSTAAWLGDMLWSDTGLSIVMLLDVTVFAIVYFLFGVVTASLAPKNMLLRVAAVSPVALLGTAIWMFSYLHQGSADPINAFGWMPYNLYVYWAAEPIWDYLAVYVRGETFLKWFVLAFVFLPGASTLAGISVRQRVLAGRLRARRVVRAIAAWPVLLILLLAGMTLVARLTAPYSLSTMPKMDGATAAIPFGGVLVQQMTGVNRVAAGRAVQFHTTHNAYVNLINKETDLIFVAGPSNEELALAKQQGVTMKLTPIGKDAFLFLVHKNNPVDGLTSGQVKQIYTGDIVNWKEVGGEDNPIVAFQREPNSGSQTFMEQKVMAGHPLADPPMTSRISGMGGLIESVANFANARTSLGYSFYYYAKEMNRNQHVKFLAIDGVVPGQDAIRSGTYPFTATLYAVTREDEPADSAVSRTLAWLLSPEGRQAVEKGGFVPYASP